jgi:hypothetical protein
MEELKVSLLEAADMMYAGEESAGVELLMRQVGGIGGIPGVAVWVNPLFDALDRADYIYAADLICGEITVLIT